VRLLAVDKPVVVAGDLNCAHEEIDIDRPEHNRSNPGFSAAERASFAARLLGDGDHGGCALIDTFRAKFPNTVGFTFSGEFFFKCERFF
jgi:exodeoxyribonuclease-3